MLSSDLAFGFDTHTHTHTHTHTEPHKKKEKKVRGVKRVGKGGVGVWLEKN